MTRSGAGWERWGSPLLIVVMLGAAVSCDEQLESGVACPALCPQQASSLKDTTFDVVEFDSVVQGYPPTGAEGRLLLAARPGTLDARAIVRFDTIRETFRHLNGTEDSLVVAIDSAFVRLRIAQSDTLGPSVTVELYDVDIDTTGTGPVDDTARANLLPLFTPSRLVGSRTFAPTDLKDSISVRLDTAAVMDRLRRTTNRRLRLGLRLVSAQPAELAVFSANGGYPPVLFVRPAGDSTIVMNINYARSDTPASDATIAAELADFQLIASGPAPPPAGVLRVGGVPANRTYLRFAVPARILDSSAVVRATLLLTQRPTTTSLAPSDSAFVVPHEMTAGAAITDLKRALLFLAAPLDSLLLAPQDSALRQFEVIDAVRRWRGTSALRTPRAIGLRASSEGRTAWQADFFGRGAAPAVRPRLRVTYIPQSAPGLP